MTLSPAPCFGDVIENGWASEENPTRVGRFVREGRRTGRMNAGRYLEVTDGNGKFWELPVTADHKITVRRYPERTEEPQCPEGWARCEGELVSHLAQASRRLGILAAHHNSDPGRQWATEIERFLEGYYEKARAMLAPPPQPAVGEG